MPINAHPEFFKTETEYLKAKTIEDKIYWTEQMLRTAPKHKGSENLLAELKTRLKKLKEKSEKASKRSGSRKGIRKEGFQFVIIGFQNAGKSTLLSKLTNAQPKISEYGFSTIQPEVGTFDYTGVKAQIIDLPPLGSESFDIGLANNADCLIFVVESLDEIEKIEKSIPRAIGKKIIVFNKSDLLNENERRRIEAQIKSKRINGVVVSAKENLNLENLKEKLFKEMHVIRIYMKEPGKEKSNIPMVMPEGSTVQNVAEEILKGFSKKVRESRLTGPSSKFPNQKVGLTHVLKDRDVIEFHAR